MLGLYQNDNNNIRLFLLLIDNSNYSGLPPNKGKTPINFFKKKKAFQSIYSGYFLFFNFTILSMENIFYNVSKPLSKASMK